MNDFSYPNVINYFGLPGSPNNKMEPGKRPLSSMSPAIITDGNGDVKMVVGASGYKDYHYCCSGKFAKTTS